MRELELIAVATVAALLISCETTNQAGAGNQEQKRLAQIQREQAENAQYDESDINLWNAHQDNLAKGTNPALPYTQLAHH